MADNFNISDNLNTIFEKLEKFLQTKTVVGEPLVIGATTIVPFAEISFGLGTGGGGGTDEKNNQGTGGGAGSGARISPTAILVIQGDKAEIMPIRKGGSMDKLIEMVPDIMEKVKGMEKSKEQKSSE
ncbi:MAG TPA: spore germination protein GerW family protein [Desulfitobacteriaceae bacterium]|nr:spore germination protein GerW family protein [Desulfitobacteriaceae bacterium]